MSKFNKLFEFWKDGHFLNYKSFSEFERDTKSCDFCKFPDEPQWRKGSELDKNAIWGAAEIYYNICLNCRHVYCYCY